MSFFDRFFQFKPPREALADGEFIALPTVFAQFGDWISLRIVYSPDPRHQNDLAPVHSALWNELAASKRCHDEPFHRFKPQTRQIAKSRAGAVPVWLRDVNLPVRELPKGFLEGDGAYPLWLRETGRYRIEFAERPADTAGARARQRIRRVKRRNGRPVRAALVQANNGMYEPGEDDLPGMVLYAVDDRISDEQLREWAQAVFALKNTEPDDSIDAAVAAITSDERFLWYGRHRIPRRIVGKLDVFAAHLQFHRPFLDEGYLDGQMIMCVVEPGERGLIEHIPEGDGE